MSSSASPSAALVKTVAHACGFELAGIAAAAPVPEAGFYHDWVAAGMAGEMRYLTDRRAGLRDDPRQWLPSARSILSVGKLYNGPQPYSTQFAGGDQAWISRYAWGEDYHDVLRRGLECVVEGLRAALGEPFEWKICVDTAPVLERAYARHAGLGWIAKNTCLINQAMGSWFFLGELLLSLELAPDQPPPDRCGSCTRCIEACPTEAIVPTGCADGPAWALDSRLCISYFTIELRGSPPVETRAATGRHVFGCDICQDVCPWNRRAPVTNEPAFAPAHFAPPLERLAALSEQEFREMFRHSPITRARYTGFLRNVAVAMGNAADPKFRAPLEKLANSPDTMVAEAARWALCRDIIFMVPRMHVLIADKFEQSGQDGLKAAGCEVTYQPGLKDDALAQAVAQMRPDALVVRSTKVTDAILAAGALKLVVRAGAGYNTIDVAAASRRGIYVSNCPGKNSVAVAELAFTLILALDRRVADNVIALRQGQWNKSEFSKARGLYGRTLGLIGLGRIGREMVPRAKAFGMPVISWSRSLTPESAKSLGVEFQESPVDVARAADIVSVHVAANAQTAGLIDSSFFEAMRPGSYFINTSRAEVVDQVALGWAVRSNGVRAGLDVYAAEPSGGTGEFTDEIVKLPGVYGTHHIGASTDQAQEAIAAETVRIIATFKDTGKVPNVVNIARATPATCALVVRHQDRPGVLASVLDLISAARINVQEMENIIFDGAEAAVARINLETVPAAELLDQIKQSNPNVIELSLIRL